MLLIKGCFVSVERWWKRKSEEPHQPYCQNPTWLHGALQVFSALYVAHKIRHTGKCTVQHFCKNLQKCSLQSLVKASICSVEGCCHWMELRWRDIMQKRLGSSVPWYKNCIETTQEKSNVSEEMQLLAHRKSLQSDIWISKFLSSHHPLSSFTSTAENLHFLHSIALWKSTIPI